MVVVLLDVECEQVRHAGRSDHASIVVKSVAKLEFQCVFTDVDHAGVRTPDG